MSRLFISIVSPLCFAAATLAFAAFSRRRFSRVVCLVALLVLFLSGSGAGSDLLIRSLENRYREVPIEEIPPAEAIVVLGGYLHQRSGAVRPVELNGASDRLLLAAQLYWGGKAPLILLSGGSANSVPEAIAASRILQQWGIPSAAILTEDASRDTHENAVFSWSILSQQRIGRILLVTSATHMPRATATFQRVGFFVVPCAADFLAGDEDNNLLISLVPSAGALSNSGLVIKEWIGIVAYHMRGWAI